MILPARLFGYVARAIGNTGVSLRVMILTLPSILALLALATLLLQQQRDDLERSRRIAGLSSLTTSIGALVHELQKERGASGIVLSSHGTRFLSLLLAQRQLTDRQVALLTQPADPALIRPGSELADRVAEAQADLHELPALRAHVDTLDIPPAGSFEWYTRTISHLLGIVLEGGATAQDAAATRTFLAMFNLMEGKERAGQERATGGQGFAAGRFSPAMLDRMHALQDEQDSFFRSSDAYATVEQRAILRVRLADPVNDEITTLRRLIMEGGREGQLGQIDAATWFGVATHRINLLREVEILLADEVRARAHAEAKAASLRFRISFAAIIALVAGIATASVAIGRGLAGSILRMTRVMTALADGDHAVVIPHRERDNEIGKMAAAIEVFRANAVARQERDAQIIHMARHDALTGLPNRTTFHERLEHSVALVGRGGIAAVFCIDLDDFKAVNDTLGHFAGDCYLRIMADRLQACARDTDMVARLGGDEFAIVQIGLTRPDDARPLAERLLQMIGRPLDLDGRRLQPRLSIGIAVAPADGTGAEKLMRSADVALHRAKTDGGHGYRFFEEEMEARLKARRRMEAELQSAVAANAFVLFYQPLVDARTSAIMGFEALVRWAHPTLGTVPPSDFISLAEETGLIIPLGGWILEQACLDAAGWQEPLSVAVNLSVVQFKDPHLLQRVQDALRQSGLPASRLELEITESLLLRDDERTIATLHTLSTMGIRISMDDFGTGYSSLSYLNSFPFNKIKIDQSFIRNLGLKDDAAAIVRAIVTLGDNLGMVVTAEGVETVAQRDRLRAAGCTQLQGYLFSKPRPAADVPAMIRAQAEQPLLLA